MYTISDEIIDEYIIKNSRFITLLYKINDIDEVKKKLHEAQLEYPNATHYTYAYILCNMKKSSDDGEPGGTAGVPILKVLENNGLNYILAIVIRYFGGIKLGAGGLVRAYTKSVTNALGKIRLNELIDGLNVDLIFEYDKLKTIDYLLKDSKINNKAYNELITYNVDIPCDFLDTIKSKNISYKIIKNIKLEK